MPGQHARLSPSSAHRWTICHAAPSREAARAQVRDSNRAADTGTVMHDLGEHGLLKGDQYIDERRGTRAMVLDDGTVVYAPADSQFYLDGIEVDDEVANGAQSYVDFVRQLALGGDLYVEERLSIEHITGEPGAKGTSDTIICFPDELCIVDLKGGFKRVAASEPFEGDLYRLGPQEMRDRSLVEQIVVPNQQLAMYASACLERFGPFYDFKRVRLVICQPRLGATSEAVFDLDDFATWIDWIAEQAIQCGGSNPRVVPGEKQCQWCKVFPCAEATQLATSVALDDFDQTAEPPSHPLDLSRAKGLVPFVRAWAAAVDEQVHARLARGEPVPGWKLVDGDLGDRKWTNEQEAALTMAASGLSPEQYTTSKVISPSVAEGLVRRSARSKHKPLSEDDWQSLQELITRTEAQPKVVPESDPRQKRTSPQEDFE